MLTVALSKGYLLDEAMQLFAKVGIEVPYKKEEISRKLEFYDVTGHYRFLAIRPTDVPVYVECGAADIGVSGRDVILEGEHKVAQLLDLKFGYCRLATAGVKGKFTPDSYFSECAWRLNSLTLLQRFLSNAELILNLLNCMDQWSSPL